MVVVLHWFCAWMHSVYRSAEKMGSPLLRCPPRVPYLSTWHAASPQDRLCHVPIFQLPTLDPTHLRTSHLENCKSTFCFEAASVSSTIAKPWFQPKKTPHAGPRARYAQSDFDRKGCTPALYASFLCYASLRLYKPRGMHSLMRTYLPTVLFV